MQTVLVVDDESNMRFVVRTILVDEGYTVIEAPNGAVALRLTAESRPDVIVTDLMMPVMGGAELIARLRADPATAEIPIVVVSATGSLSTSADIVLGKPFKPELLADAVGALAGRES